jgi:hypothetical protein
LCFSSSLNARASYRFIESHPSVYRALFGEGFSCVDQCMGRTHGARQEFRSIVRTTVQTNERTHW